MQSLFEGFRFLDFVNYVLGGFAFLYVCAGQEKSFQVVHSWIVNANGSFIASLVVLSLVAGILVFVVTQACMALFKLMMESLSVLETCKFAKAKEWSPLWSPHYDLTKSFRRCVRGAYEHKYIVFEFNPATKVWTFKERFPKYDVYHPLIRAMSEDIAYASSDTEYLLKLSALRRLSMAMTVVSIFWLTWILIAKSTISNSDLISFDYVDRNKFWMSISCSISFFLMFAYFDRKYFVQECADGFANLTRRKSTIWK